MCDSRVRCGYSDEQLADTIVDTTANACDVRGLNSHPRIMRIHQTIAPLVSGSCIASGVAGREWRATRGRSAAAAALLGENAGGYSVESGARRLRTRSGQSAA